MGIEIEDAADDAAGDTLGAELALERARAGGHGDAIADALLQKQTEKLDHELRHLKLKSINEWFAITLKGLVALTGLVLVGVVTAMAVDAASSHALVVQAFHVPPDLEEKGVDGAVLANQVLDKLNAMRADTQSEAQSSGYSAEPAAETKLEIPETGVSLGELHHLLREWLGHDIHISGSLVHQTLGDRVLGDQALGNKGDQLSLTTRTGTEAHSFAGAAAELDKLVTQSAESVFAATQPLAFADYLRSSNRRDEAEALLKRLTSLGTPNDRAWAYVELGEVLRERRDLDGAQHAFDEAAQLNPNLWLVWEDLAGLRNYSAADEEGGFRYRLKAVAATDFGGANQVAARHFHEGDRVYLDEALGNYAAAFASQSREAAEQNDPDLAYQSSYLTAYEAAYLHDPELSRQWTRRALDHVFAMRRQDVLGGQNRDPKVVVGRLAYWQLAAVDDWAGAAKAMQDANVGFKGATRVYWEALQALALVRAGQLPSARAVLDPLPERCHYCLLARALLAEASGDKAGADHLFARELRDYPSIVRGNEYWGQVKLARGDLDGAIALFRKMHDKGPNFADALEGWGEALLRKGDYSGAIEKFAQAASHAPNWGRNHLRWGQALVKAGKTEKAKAQFAIARGLALSAADRAQLPG